jgi:aminomethyltransferase
MARRTPLYDAHRRAGGKLVEFAGWELPIQFKGIIEEHLAVRSAAGLFDVSHMGEVFIEGPKALEAVQRLITPDVAKGRDGQAFYSGLLNERGGFVDDVVCYRFSEQKLLLVVNAANRDKDSAWIADHAGGATVSDQSDAWAQLALQGPKAQAILARLTKIALEDIAWYRFHPGPAEVAGVPCLLTRTGYTGEDGFELYCPPERAIALWDALLDVGTAEGLVPCGLGARDSLRLEMRYALYGNDIDGDHTPLEAGLGWIVRMDKGDFIGREALARQKASGLKRKLAGFTTTDKTIPRHGYRLLKDGLPIGLVTSGTQSPSLKKPIGLGYVPAELSAEGSTFEVEVRGRAAGAVVVKTPFYQPPSRR